MHQVPHELFGGFGGPKTGSQTATRSLVSCFLPALNIGRPQCESGRITQLPVAVIVGDTIGQVSRGRAGLYNNSTFKTMRSEVNTDPFKFF